MMSEQVGGPRLLASQEFYKALYAVHYLNSLQQQQQQQGCGGGVAAPCRQLTAAAVKHQQSVKAAVEFKPRKLDLKDKDDDADDDKKMVVDGGCLAWSIVFSSFMISFLQDGFRDSFGLLLPSISEHFKTGRTQAALTNSLMTLMTLGSGPFVALLIQKLGHRTVTLIGVGLSVSGLLLAGVSLEYLDPPSLLLLYLSVGIMTGLGFGLMYLPAMDIVELYFDRNLGLATGIAAAGSGIGQLVMAPLISLAKESLGLAFTLALLASTVFLATGFAFMYKQPKKGLDLQPPKVDLATQGEAKEGWLRSLISCYVSLLKTPAMSVLLLSHFLMHLAIFAAFNFSADRAAHLGLDHRHTSYLLAIMGVSNCLGRILYGKALDAFRPRTFAMTTGVLLVNAGAVAGSDCLTSFGGQAVYAAVFGATFGAYISSLMVVLRLVVVNGARVTEALGLSLLTFGLASLAGPAVVGQIYDVYGSYRAGFLLVGGMGAVGALLLPLVQHLAHKAKQSKL